MHGVMKICLSEKEITVNLREAMLLLLGEGDVEALNNYFHKMKKKIMKGFII